MLPLRMHNVAVGHIYVGWIHFVWNRMPGWGLMWLAGAEFLGGSQWFRLKEVSPTLVQREGRRGADSLLSDPRPKGEGEGVGRYM